jgi:hypothetical protein
VAYFKYASWFVMPANSLPYLEYDNNFVQTEQHPAYLTHVPGSVIMDVLNKIIQIWKRYSKLGHP